MDNLIQFIVTNSALDGDRGASIARLWHFVSCFYSQTHVHPTHYRSIPYPANTLIISDLVLDPNAFIPGLDWDLLEHIWSILIDVCPDYIHLVQLVATPNSTPKAPIPSKTWKTADKASLALNKISEAWVATPLQKHTIDATPLSQLLADHGDTLRLYIPPIERTSILRKNECGDMSEQLSKVYDEILYRRALGCTQADLSKTLTIDPRSVFYFTKLLAAKDCIFKVPVSSNGQSTQLCLATQFAPLNHAYQSYMAGSASIPCQAFADPSPATTITPFESYTDPVPTFSLTNTDNHSTTKDHIDEDSAKESINEFPAVAAKTFPPAEEVFASSKSQNKDIPCIIGEVIRTRICSILQAQQGNALASEPLLHAVGLRPLDFPRHRKWFNTAVGVLGKQRQLEVIKVEAPIDSASAVLTPLQFKAWDAATFERTHGPTVRICKLITAPVQVPETNSPLTPNTLVEEPIIHDPTLTQQNGVLFDLPFEYQILRLLANAPLGLTGLQLRRQIGGLSAKMFNKFMERFTIPRKNLPENAVVLRRACESRGRERRNRYFADYVNPSFLLALRSVHVLSSVTIADNRVTANPNCLNPTPLIGASQSVPSLPNESVNPSNTGIETPPLALSMSLYNLNSHKNVTEQTKQRRIVMLDILLQERVLEYNKDLLRVFDEAYNARFPFVTSDNHDSAQIIKNQRSTTQSHRPFMDKTTMWRVVDYLRRECCVLEHRVLNIPLIHGGSKYREFLIHRNADPPVTHDEIIRRAQITERSQHLGANGWSISTGWNEIGDASHNPTPPTCSSNVGNGQQQSEHFDKNWRGISIEYGWIDSRILRARKLYHLLYCKTRLQYEADPLGAPPILESSLINSSLTFGMYLSLIGHTRKSHVIQAAMHDHQDTPLSEIGRDVMTEIMGSEKKIRRFRIRLSLLLNILIALNLIHPLDPHHSGLNLPNYNTVAENMPIYPAYAIPRKVYLLDYLATRSERTVRGEFDLSTDFQVIMFWETLRMLCVTKPVTRAIQESHELNVLDSQDSIMGLAQPFTDLIPDSIGTVQWGMGNRDLDPIKFIGLTTNWFSTFRFSPAVKGELKREYQKLRRSGQIPSTIHPACLEIARKIMAPVEQVKRYFRLLEQEQPKTRRQRVGRSRGDTEEQQQDNQKRPRSPSTTRSSKRQRMSDIGSPTGDHMGSGVLQDGWDMIGVDLVDQDAGQDDVPSSKQRKRYKWSKECDHLLLVCYVIMRHRQLIGMAPKISWQLASTYFINLNRESMRNRIIRLLHRSENIRKVKDLHQAWVAHVFNCPQCDTHSELVFNHPSGIVNGYHNLDLHTAVPHLAGISISEMKAGSIDGPELPDSLEDLHQNFRCLVNKTSASRDPAEAISSHLRLVDMYEKAWYISSGSESTSTNLFSPLDLDKDLVKVHNHAVHGCQPTTSAQKGNITDDTFMDTTPTQPNESHWFQGEDVNKIPLVMQLLKMICLTPESQYDPSLAFMLLSQFTTPVLECAITRAHNEGILVKKSCNVRSRPIPHRRHTLSERFIVDFLGQDAQLHIAQALMSLKELRNRGYLHTTNVPDCNSSSLSPLIPEDRQFILNDFVNEGTMLALIDLMVTRDIHFTVHFDMGELLGSNIFPPPIRHKDINPLVYVQVLTSLPNPTPLFDLETNQLPSTHPHILAQGPTSDIMRCGLQVQGKPDLSNRDAGWAIQVGVDTHVWIDTSDASSMQIHTLAKHPSGIACDYFDKDKHVSVYETQVHPQLRTRIIPRIWNDIRGNVTPSVLRSALTSVLVFLMRYPGAAETWMREKLKVIFTSTEVTELISQLIYRGAVSAQMGEGNLNRYLFLNQGFFYRIL